MNDSPATKIDVARLEGKLDKITMLVTNIEISLTDKVVMHEKEIENLKKRVALLESQSVS